ncbi:hypothetical protein [Undibacterium parvum]|uniref:Uncharacterized protein n=2 Tax=Undibacterium TaxID=401469 RepID=A0A6M4A5X7_9BURK|nr:hypothetical protein [Undibacterium parvum]AZP12551.1 hypothetical protein EJN92_11365 [Undibacterium parvum]QJQ06772.1 hypothetical protein EJG51_014000 [Undibacterium piscinae]
MNNWRENLSRLAAEFWCGIGDLAELRTWADVANKETGEAHSQIWDIYTVADHKHATDLLLSMASDINGFKLESWEAEPFAMSAFKKALDAFFSRSMPVQTFCKLVEKLDATYNIGLAGVPKPESLQSHEEWWLGNLWNCCDWCDESWTMENSSPLLAEAQRVSKVLANIGVKRDVPHAARPLP